MFPNIYNVRGRIGAKSFWAKELPLPFVFLRRLASAFDSLSVNSYYQLNSFSPFLVLTREITELFLNKVGSEPCRSVGQGGVDEGCVPKTAGAPY